MSASAFFVTYEMLKESLPRSIPLLSESPSLNHMVSASGAEFVSQSAHLGNVGGIMLTY